MIDNSKEHILCAAVLRKEPSDCPRVYWPKYHDIYKCELGWRHPDILHKFKGIVQTGPDAQGFFTSHGRFVSREEGLKIARECGQVSETIGGMLTSEDLY